MNDSQRINFKRKLALALPDMRDLSLDDLVNKKPLRWAMKQRIFICVFEKSPLLEEYVNEIQDLVEHRNAELAEQRMKGTVNKEVKVEKEAVFRTRFMGQVLRGLERLKWPPTLIPFHDPMNDLLHDDSTFVDSVDFLLSVIDPRLDTHGVALPTNPQPRLSPPPKTALREDVLAREDSSTLSHIIDSQSTGRGIDSAKKPSSASGRMVSSAVRNTSSAGSHALAGLDVSSIRRAIPSSRENSFFSLSGIESTVCQSCGGAGQRQSDPAPQNARVVDILMSQNQQLTREVQRLQSLLKKREAVDKSLRESAFSLRQVLSESLATNALGTSSASPNKQLTIPSKIANCLHSLESAIEQSDGKQQLNNQTSHSNISDSMRSYLSNTRTASLLDDKAHQGNSRQFPFQHTDKLGTGDDNIHETQQQLQRELIYFAERVTAAFVGKTEDTTTLENNEKSLQMRSLRSLALQLSLKVSRLTGWNTLNSDGMKQCSAWKLLASISSIDRKSVPKHILASLQADGEAIVSDYNALYNQIVLLMAREQSWCKTEKKIASSLAIIRKNVNLFLKSFREEVMKGLASVAAVSDAYSQVSKARLKDSKNSGKDKRGVVDLLVNGTMGPEAAEWVMVMKEHAESIAGLPQLLEYHVNGVGRVLDKELSNLSGLV